MTALPQGWTLDAPASGPASPTLPPGFTLDPATNGKASVLPFNWDAKGVHFDPSAGLMGTIGRALSLPGDVYAGKTDPLSNEGIGRATDLASFATPAGAGAAWMRRPSVAVPSSAELKTEGGAGRNLARSMGVVYSTDSVVGLAGKTQADLLQAGLGPKVAQQTNAVLADLQKVPDDPTAQADFTTTIEAARNNLQSIAQNSADGQERRAASQAIGAIDQYIKRPDPGSVVAGPASALGEVFSDANSNYASGSRSQALEAILKRSTDRASSSNSGLNLDNSVRGRIASFIAPGTNGGPSAAERSGFTKSEVALLQNIVDGKNGANALRWFGNILGGGGGLGAVATGAAGGVAGASVGNPVAGAMLGVALPLAGLGAKLGENAITKRALSGAAEQLRMRSASYADRQAAVPPQQTSPASRALILRTMLQGIPHPANPFAPPQQLVYGPGGNAT